MEKKKRLLITSDAFLPRWDGVARFLSEVIPKLSEEYKITVLAPKFQGKNPSYKGVKIARIPLSMFRFGDYPMPKMKFREVEKYVKETDIVFNQTIGPIGISAIRAASRHKKPIVSYIHSIEWELFSKSVNRFKRLITWATKAAAKRLYNKCSLILVPSKGVISVMEDAGIKTRKQVVRLGTDIAKFIPPVEKNRAKRNIKINTRYKVIGFCGRIGREKSIETLGQAFEIISKKRTDVQLLIVGKGLEEEQRKLLTEKRVIMTGAKDNVVPYLQAMDIYVLPSLTETTSLSTLEAMSCGIPVVVTKVGYIRKYIKNMTNGVFFQKQDAEDLAEKIEYLLENQDEMLRIGEAGRRTVVKRFNWENTVQGIKNALEEVQDWKLVG